MEPKTIAERAATLGFPAIALTDRNGLYGAMPFSDACTAKGVQPIIGAMLAVARPPEMGPAALDWLVLLAKDEEGYANLCKLVSAAHLDRPISEDPHVSAALLEGLNEGLIVLTAGSDGAVARLLADGQRDKAEAYLDRLQSLFPGRLYIEIVRRGDPVEEASEPALIELAYARNLPLVATNPAAYSDPAFHAAHDAMLCIASSAYVETAERVTSSPEAWLKDGAAMTELFADLPEAIANSVIPFCFATAGFLSGSMYSVGTCFEAYSYSFSLSRYAGTRRPARTPSPERRIELRDDVAALVRQAELLVRGQVPALVLPRADVVDGDQDAEHDEDADAGQRAVARLAPREHLRDLAPLAERVGEHADQAGPRQVVGVLFLAPGRPKRIASATNTSAVPSQPMN